MTVTFQVLCRPQFGGTCGLPDDSVTTISFPVSTDDFCPRVVEVASVTPSLTTSATKDGAASTNFVLRSTLHARVDVGVEAGVQTQQVTRLTDV